MDQIPPEFCLDLFEPGGWILKDITAHDTRYEWKAIICFSDPIRTLHLGAWW